MTLGALLDAGLSLGALEEQLGGLGLAGYRLEGAGREDQGIHGTQLTVVVEEGEQPARRLPEIVGLLESSRLSGDVVRGRGRCLSGWRGRRRRCMGWGRRRCTSMRLGRWLG